MSKINIIQEKIRNLEGGSFQKLFDAYLYKKYRFNNIQTLGVQYGTNKTTKGIPDSYVLTDNGKYILIMYGTVDAEAFNKLKKDILSCFDKDKVNINEEKIEKIICAYSSTNIHIEQLEELRNMIPGKEIELIGLSTISHDLLVNFPFIAYEYLNIQVDTHQIFSIEEFINIYDKNGINAPLDMKFFYRNQEKEILYTMINSGKVTLVTGKSGVGKTRIVLEVCRQFENEGWNVLCIKNNGEFLYSDIKYYISDEGKYLLFIDDANQTTSLEYVLDYVTSLSENMVVKIVMTVRNYANYRVRKVICNYMIPEELTIKLFKDDEIKEILKENLKIKNIDYLRKIVLIAKGNIRLAILAGKLSIENGYPAISNATDIFAQYYGRIIETTQLSREEVNALFVISLLGTIRYGQSEFAQVILELLDINLEQFIMLCHSLNEKELIDLYKDEVVKDSDQSLGDYILEYVLIEKKTISIALLLQMGFPKIKNKLVYAINTMLQLFYSKDLEKYIEEQINMSWNMAEEELQSEYLKCFYSVNEEKALSIIKRRIDNDKSVDKSILDYDIEGKKNNKKIKSDEISILSKFKYSEYFEDAIELMIAYYKKRPDLIMDLYFAFSKNMSFDEYSYRLNYEKEYKLIESLYKYSDNGKDVNVTVLLLHILKEMLKCNIHKSELERDNRTINCINVHIVYSAGSKKIRLLIFKILSELYNNDLYEKLVRKIISGNYISGMDKNEARKIYLYDLKCIKELFVDKWQSLSFEQCKMIRTLEVNSGWLEIDNKDLFQRYNENDDFVIYNTLARRHSRGKTWQEDEEDRKREIEEMIKGYTKNDYAHLFKICKKCEDSKELGDSLLNSSLGIVFKYIENDMKLYNEIVELYLQNKAPYGYGRDRIVVMLIENMGLKHTKRLIEKYDFLYQHNWISTMWRSLPEEIVNEKYVEMFLQFIEKEAESERPEFPAVIYLEKFYKIDKNVIRKVSEVIIKYIERKDSSLSEYNALGYSNKGYIASEFLDYSFKDIRIDLILNLFSENEDLLEKLYLLALGNSFDYNGKLLIELIKRNPEFWDEFTLKLSDNIQRTSFEHNIFERIWKMDNYEELIDTAFKNIITSYYDFSTEDGASTVFANSKETADLVKERKKQWIKDYIRKNIENKSNLKKIFYIILLCFRAERKEFLFELLTYSKEVDIFSCINLVSRPSSWSGSEIPYIDNEIEFLNDLINSIKGVEFIEHRAYLKESKNSLEEYRYKVVIEEYLESGDIA